MVLGGLSFSYAQNNTVTEAQPDQLPEQRSSKIDAVWTTANKSLRQLEDLSESLKPSIETPPSWTVLDSGQATARRTLIQSEGTGFRRDLGLDLQAGYHYYSSYDLDFPTSSFRNSAYAGVRWRLLRGGLGEARLKAQRAEAVLFADSLAVSLEARQGILSGVGNELVAASFRNKAVLLDIFCEFLDRNVKIAKQLYYAGAIPADDVTAVQRDLERSQIRRNAYHTYAEGFEKRFGTISDPMLMEPREIDLSRLTDAFGQGNTDIAAARLHESQVRAKHAAASNINLDLFVRENVYTASGNTSQGPSAGVALSVPLAYLSPSQRRIERAENAYRSSGGMSLADGRYRDLLNEYSEYEFLRQNYTENVYNKLRLTERLRREKLVGSQNKQDNQPMIAYQRVRELFENQLERMEITEQLNLRLLKIRAAAGIKSFEPFFIARQQRENSPALVRPGNREIYVWSNDFAANDNTFLVDFCKAKQISRILLSYSQSSDTAKLRDLIPVCRKAGIQVFLMLSETSLFEPEKQRVLGGKLAEMASFSPDGVHLDIEPHTIPSWKDDNYRLLWTYVDMLKFVRKSYTKTLSVSIPVSYPKDVCAAIAGQVDYVNCMAYGLKNVDGASAALKDELKVFGSNLYAAVRCSDFNDETAMEAWIEQLNQNLKIRGFAIYGFSQYNQLVQQK